MDEVEFRDHVVGSLARIETKVGGLGERVDDLEDIEAPARLATLEERTGGGKKAGLLGGLGGALAAIGAIIGKSVTGL